MNIGLDMMGGDFAPLEAVKGLKRFLTGNNTPVNLFLIGDDQAVKPLLESAGINADNIHVVHAPEVIGMNEHPTKALKEKPQSSISVGFHLLASGKTDAFISAGNTGAMLVGSMYSLKPIEGILRPTISTILPKVNGSTGLLLDVGINADCKPENLQQFGILGSIYAKNILGIENPRVALINIGEEEGKGNLLAQAAYPLLKETPGINFVGNVEGRDLFMDKADVMICEGFTGNIILKLAESLFDISGIRGLNDEYFDRFNFESHGGTPVLGVNKPVVIGHGISHELAFSKMIELAVKLVETNLPEKIKAQFTSEA